MLDPEKTQENPRDLETASQLRESKLFQIKTDLKTVYPFLFFDTERARKRPDQETQDLHHRLSTIGNMRPVDQQSKADLEAIKRRWEEDAKEKAKRGGRISFTGMDFSDLDLSDMDLSGLEFGHTYFDRANLSGVNFKNSAFMLARLKSANLDRANLEGAIFIDADLTDTFLEGANMKGNFVYSNFEGSNVKNATLDPRGLFKVRNFPIPIHFPKRDMRQEVEGMLGNSSKNSTEVKESEAILQDVQDLLKLYREYLKTKPALHDPVVITLRDELIALGKEVPKSEKEREKLYAKKLDWSLRKNDLGKVLDFDGADLSGLDLSTMDLTNLSLIGANCSRTDFTWSILSGNNCSLADFSGALLRMDALRGFLPFGASFKGANLSAARIRDTACILADFTDAKIEYVDSKKAVLLGAKFDNATIEESNFEGSANLENLKSAQFA